MHRTARRDPVQMLERDAELASLDEALSTARAGAGSVVVVEAVAGMGKTRLVTWTRERAGAAGLRVFSARGSELERAMPFGVVRQLFEPTVIDAPALLTGAAAMAWPLFGSTAGERLPEDRALELMHGLYWLVARLADPGPVLLAVDDAHWADGMSLRFLVYLAARLGGLPLAVLVAARPAERANEEDLLLRLATDPSAVELAPGPLGSGAIAQLLQTDLGRQPDLPFVEACAAATGGVPFLVRELVRELAEAGTDPDAAAAGRIPDLGPEGVARWVVARIRRVDCEALPVAQAAAALGADADLRRVASLVGTPVRRAAELVEALARAGIMDPGAEAEFAHPMLAAAVLRRLPAVRRGRLHDQAADLLAREGAAPERVAAHLLRTAARGDAARAALLRAAGDGSLARGDPDAAAAHLERALEEQPPPTERLRILRALAAAELRLGRRASVGHLQEALRIAGGPSERADIARELAGPLMAARRPTDAMQVLVDALRAVSGRDDDRELALRGELLLVATIEPSALAGVERTFLADRVPEDGRTPGIREYLAALTAHRTLHGYATAAETVTLGTRARDAGIVEELDAGSIGWANVCYPLLAADAFGLVDAMLDEADRHLERHPSLLGAARVHAVRSGLALARGRTREAVADAQTAVEVGRQAGFQGWPVALSTLLDGLATLGDLKAADRVLAQVGLAGEIPDTFMHTWALGARGRLRLAEGRLELAVADLESLAARCRERGHENPGLFGYRPWLALAALRTGERQRAAALAEEGLGLARRWGAPRPLGLALRVSGLVQGGEEGRRRLGESAELLEPCGARLEAAHSLVELGAALRRGNRRSEARGPLRRGRELAHACAARRLGERAHEELLATGARPRRVDSTGVDSLTPSELRVARLAAAGAGNREIAEGLFVTLRTVETHLTHLFRKLGIRSRDELPEALGSGPD